MIVDTEAAMRFIRTAYEPDDWIALFLKSYDTGKTAQRVGPLSLFLEPRVHAGLRAMNAGRYNCYVGVNSIKPGVRSRTKDAIDRVRHMFIETDGDGAQLLATFAGRRDLPTPSYIIESSPNRLHVLWRVTGFTTDRVEWLQKCLARELGTDTAATSCSQTTRVLTRSDGRDVPIYSTPYRERVATKQASKKEIRDALPCCSETLFEKGRSKSRCAMWGSRRSRATSSGSGKCATRLHGSRFGSGCSRRLAPKEGERLLDVLERAQLNEVRAIAEQLRREFEAPHIDEADVPVLEVVDLLQKSDPPREAIAHAFCAGFGFELRVNRDPQAGKPGHGPCHTLTLRERRNRGCGMARPVRKP